MFQHRWPFFYQPFLLAVGLWLAALGNWLIRLGERESESVSDAGQEGIETLGFIKEMVFAQSQHHQQVMEILTEMTSALRVLTQQNRQQANALLTMLPDLNFKDVSGSQRRRIRTHDQNPTPFARRPSYDPFARSQDETLFDRTVEEGSAGDPRAFTLGTRTDCHGESKDQMAGTDPHDDGSGGL